MFDILYELSKMPALPGIYIMKDSKKRIIYIGKAKNLKTRIRQYFQNQNNILPKTKMMISEISEFETIITSSEVEALILERNLIKKHRPRFNVVLKDDKNYPLIKITMQEEYPRILMTRKVEQDGSKYFGPFTSGYAVKETIEFINKIYPLRNCEKMSSGRPCINYQIGRCLAPCQGEVKVKQYRELVKEACIFLDGKINLVIKQFEEKMFTYSDSLNFEKAKEYRDKIQAIKNISSRQRISQTKIDNGDFIACFGNDTKVCIQIFFLRGNNITGRKCFFINKYLEKKNTDIISEFINQYYDKEKIIPRKIFVEENIKEADVLEKYLSSIRNRSVSIVVPKRGEKKEIVDLVKKNAEIEFEKKINSIEEKDAFFKNTLDDLKKYLLLEKIKRIEAFDISNTSKNDTVAAMIVFDTSEFDRRSYRKYSVRGNYGINDYMAMSETIKRRYKIFSNASLGSIDKTKLDSSLQIKPDVIFVDGGLGHVNTVTKALSELKLKIDVIGMVKDGKHKTKGMFFEGDYFDLKGEINILRFINMIQEEVHRFALGYNKQKRKKRVISSELDIINGIGALKKKSLLNHFGSVKKIREASIRDIAQVNSIGEKLAEKIKKELY